LTAALEIAAEDDENPVVHLCIIPNYKEDEELLTQTLQSLVECQLSSRFRVVLAMEEREGDLARLKGELLWRRFSDHFADISVTMHPADLVETHLDGTFDDEVPGKASNLKWAVKNACDSCELAGIKASDVLVTVLDADCLFHPGYFRYVGKHHHELKKESSRLSKEDHLWTGYQAPQVCCRNFYQSPAVSRLWAYISTIFEVSGVSSISVGGHHMCFSSYTLPMPLVVSAGLWSGDVVAEDHHIYLKCFFHSIRSQFIRGASAHPLLHLEPVLLPVKSMSVISDEGYWKSCVDRWYQARRHAQGVSEFEYAVMAMLAMAGSAPRNLDTFFIIRRLFFLMVRLLFIHALPILQSCTLGVLTIDWVYHRGSIPECPGEIWFGDFFTTTDFFLCASAGAWALTWPVVIPLVLVVITNVTVVWFWFIMPGRKKERSVWDEEDAKVRPALGSQLLTLVALVLVDCCLLIFPVMLVYGLVPVLLSYCSSFLWGNRVTYITASKATSTSRVMLKDYRSLTMH